MPVDFRFQVVKAVQQKGEVGSGFGGQAVVLEAHILAQRVGWLPSVTEGRIGHHRIELRHLGRVGFVKPVLVIGEGVAVINLELGILHPVQQHVHARQVIGGDVGLLPINLANAMRPHLLAHIQQQRA